MNHNDPLRRIGALADRHTKTLLLAFGGYAAVATAIVWVFEGLPPTVRIPLLLPMLVFVPGFALVTAAFPHTRRSRTDQYGESLGKDGRSRIELSPLERGALSVFTSLVLVSGVAYVESALVGVQVELIFAAVAAVTILAGAAGVVRLPDTRTNRRGSRGTTRADPKSWLRGLTRGVTPIAVVLVVVLLALSGAFVVAGSSGAPMTEFYVTEGSGDQANAVDGNQTYRLGLTQHSDEQQNYTVVVTGPDGAVDTATSSDGPARISIVAQPGQTVEETYRTDVSGLESDETLQFLLYRGDPPQSPAPETAHRVLRVSANGTTGDGDTA